METISWLKPDTHSLSNGEKEKVWQNVYEASERGVSALRKGTIDIYQSINAMINAMQDRGAAASTIFGHKFKLVKLFRYLKLRIDEDDLKQAVRPIDSSRVTDDKQPTREQIRNCSSLFENSHGREAGEGASSTRGNER